MIDVEEIVREKCLAYRTEKDAVKQPKYRCSFEGAPSTAMGKKNISPNAASADRTHFG